jgi:uncharacterized protein
MHMFNKLVELRGLSKLKRRKKLTEQIIESGSVSEISQDSKNIALLTWIGTLFLGFIPSLIIYLVKKDDVYIQSQAKEALNWSITAFFGYIIAMILTFIVIGILLMPVIGICHLVFCIMGAVSTSKGKDFRSPFAIRLIK